jgi:hypothetical protein
MGVLAPVGPARGPLATAWILCRPGPFEPASSARGTSDINCAYALFNLGHALRMAGHSDEAIPILERRLRIPDQTQTVQAELAAARAEAGE